MNELALRDFCRSFVSFACSAPEGSLWLVERSGGRGLWSEAKEGAFLEWEGEHGGAFRRYPLSQGDWQPVDYVKFSALAREHCVRYFVRIGVGEATVYPPRHLCT